ncbi:MAG: 3-dehydroquinate synthase [Cytophagales bacterium]
MPNSLVRLNPQPEALLSQFFLEKSLTQLAILVDSNTYRLCYPTISQYLPKHTVIEVPSGEQHKNLNTCQTIWKELTQRNFDRHAMLLVLGGGVLGDMGGFCAATYKRGIGFVLMPTTLLAQVDASVGGKLGIDFENYKNHIGVFQLPLATLVSTAFLKTLPAHELRSGYAEVIKHCLIADRAMWDTIRKNDLLNQDWPMLIPHSIGIKESITNQDPTEKGIRKTLNFGHTLGHALETHFLDSGRPLLHGEAIAIGMIAETYIARQKGLVAEVELTEVRQYILQIFGKVTVNFDDHTILQFILQDKKNKGNTVLLALPKGLGHCMWDVAVSEMELKEALDYYRSF